MFFIFVEDLGDCWKILTAQGEEHGDGGYEYMLKKDITKVTSMRRIMP
jgi:hypothetical protein|nr:MAG TPA: hypothetical protein [Bacteriophage sp.]